MRDRPADEREMQDYEDDCTHDRPLEASLSVELRSMSEVLALADALKTAMDHARREFPYAVETLRSSDAFGEALAYRMLKTMLDDLRIVFERQTGFPGSNL